MITLFMLSILCLAGVVVSCILVGLVLAVLSLPLTILFILLPWFLRLAGVVLLIKGLLERPFRWENLLPAVAAFLLSGLIRWIF